jgi:hypothetical protein
MSWASSPRRLLMGAGSALLVVFAFPHPSPGQAACSATFNGIEAGQIGALSSPLLLGQHDTLVFSAIDPSGTTSATVSLGMGPFVVARAEVSSDAPLQELPASLDLTAGSQRAVGLLRVRGTTDNCSFDVWLRVGGRLPFTTLAGATAAGLFAVGLVEQLWASLRGGRWSLLLAGLAAIFTGVGGALLGQQWGYLQLSYLSTLGTVALAAALGLGLALILRSRRSHPRLPKGRQARDGAADTVSGPAPAKETNAISPEKDPRAAWLGWCYVLQDVDVLHLQDHTRKVGALHPGTWYLAKREAGPWTRVEATEGVEGWVPRRAIHLQGE